MVGGAATGPEGTAGAAVGRATTAVGMRGLRPDLRERPSPSTSELATVLGTGGLLDTLAAGATAAGRSKVTMSRGTGLAAVALAAPPEPAPTRRITPNATAAPRATLPPIKPRRLGLGAGTCIAGTGTVGRAAGTGTGVGTNEN